MNLAKMREYFRDLVDDTGVETNQIYTDGRIANFLNMAAPKVQAIIERQDEANFEQVQTYSVTSSTLELTLPDNVRRIQNIIRENDNRDIQLKIVNYRDLHRYNHIDVAAVRGRKLLLSKAYSQAETIRVTYTSAVNTLTESSDEITEFINTANHLLVLEAVVMAVSAEDTRASELTRRRDEFASMLVTDLMGRNALETRSVHIVEDDTYAPYPIQRS